MRQLRQPLLRQKHQLPPPLRLRRRQLQRPPVHRHFFAKSTAASAALRGCVPHCCSPYPRWLTPLWAEEVCGLCVPAPDRGDLCASTVVRCTKQDKIIVFCFTCFRCRAVCSAFLPTSVTLNAPQTHSCARHAHN
ncbi:putative mucin TcMUCII [Trypanosoma cruzi Dm28c]|uniref:Putative mucin TcMUCII n=1 Tax=Trypanosoma cruzi Dm28c TaxID=1416333 RepID=V5CYW5_TRYCR|nr:putative mucin TcMUCII [Trypanosoma cruzi Dm28c]